MIFKKAPFILICTMLICLNAKGMDLLNESYSVNEFGLEDDYLTPGIPTDFESFETNNEFNYDTLPDLQNLQNPLELQYLQNPEELEYRKDAFKDTPFDPLDNLDPLDSLGVYDDQTEYDLDFLDGVNLLDNDNFLEYDLYNQMDLADQAIENIENNNPKDSQKNNKLKKPIEKRSECKFEYTGKIYKNNKMPIYFCPFCECSGRKANIIEHIKSSNHNCPSYNYSIFDHNAHHTTKNPNGTYTCNLCKKTFNTKIEIIKHLIEHHKITVKKLKTTIENIPNIIENNKIKTPKPYNPREKRSECKFEHTGKIYKNDKNPIYFCPFCEHPSSKPIIIEHIKSLNHNLPNYNYSTFDHNAHHTTKNPNGTYTCNLCKKTSYSKIEIIRHLLEHHKITKEKLKTNIKNIPNIIKKNKIKTPKPYKPRKKYKRKKKNILPATLKPRENKCKFEHTGKVYKKNKENCPFCDYSGIKSETARHIKSSKHNFKNYNYSTFDNNVHHTTKNPNGNYTCNLCKKTFNNQIEIIRHLIEDHKITVKKLKTNIENIPNIIENSKIKTPKPYRKQNRKKIQRDILIYFCPFCDNEAQKTDIIKHIKSTRHNFKNYNYSTFDHSAHHTTKNPNGTYKCNLCKETFNTKVKIIRHLLEHHKITKDKLKTNIKNIPNIIKKNKIIIPTYTKYKVKNKNIFPDPFKPIIPIIAMNKINKKRKASEIYPQDDFTQSENPYKNRLRKRRRF